MSRKSTTLRTRRLEKGWSQLQLAEFAGLSLRTVQRIEKGHTPTIESLKAIAAVFEINFNELIDGNQFSSIDETKLSAEELDQLEHIREVQRFIRDLIAFAVMAPFLFLLSWLDNPTGNWGLWVVLFWGAYLAWEAFDVFDARDFFGKGWERRMLEKRIGRKIDL